jgi:hypothetical protein
MKVLNLGCGTRTSPHCVNIDWSISVRLRKSGVGKAIAPIVIRGERLDRFRALSGELQVHDLRKGIPAGDGTADAVYHSHVLEHLDREAVPSFLAEVHRVLKVGGVQRVVVPDLERGCRRYLAHLEASVAGTAPCMEHDNYVAALIEQMVRREPFGTSQQPSAQRWLENLVLGDARRRGETHRWMYDRVNLAQALESSGFRSVRVVDYRTSAIAGWHTIGLDRTADEAEYRPGSLYMEAFK